LGSFSKEEKGCAAAMAFLLAGLVAQLFLQITINQIFFSVFILLLLFGVFSVHDISHGVNWDIIIFLGTILSFSQIVEVAGITAWFSPMLLSLLAPIAGSLFLFLVLLYVLCVVLRFVDVAHGWIISAILSMATPMLYEDFGIHPLSCTMVFIYASNLFFFRYNQPWVGQVESVCKDAGWDPRHLATVSVLYFALGFVVLLFCGVFWRVIGIY